MSNRIIHCITCQSDKIKRKQGMFPVTVHGEIVKIPGIESYVCPECGETFLDLDNETRIDAYLEQHQPHPATAVSR
jgi:YgiT-type zinc finger domain-containing protein